MSRSRCWYLSVFAVLLGFSVGLACGATALPDLGFDALAEGCIFFVEGSKILQGKPVEVQAAVVNNTGVPPAAPVDVLFTWRRIDKEEICGFEAVSLLQLGYGRRTEISASIDTSSLVPGTYEVSVTVDPDGRIAETDETNNECSRYLYVLPVKPELRPVRLELTTASPIERGETTGIVVEVENTGDSKAGAFEVLFELAPIACPSPSAGEIAYVELVPWEEEEPKGLARVLRCVQPVEGDLEPLLPDAGFVTIGSALVPGLAQGAHTVVEQVLDSASQLDELLEELKPLFIDADAYGNLSSDELERLDERIEEELAVLRSSPGVYAVRATIIGSVGGLPEQDPDNNVITTYMTVEWSELDYPELRPVEITLTHNTPVEWRLPNGPTVGVTVIVTNVGGSIAEPATGGDDIVVSYYVRRAGSGVENPWEHSGDDTIAQIAVEEGLNTSTAYKEINFGTPGEYQIKVVVDATEAVTEVNEDNNEILTGLTVEGTELHPVRVELGAAPIRQGDTIEIVSEVENTGRLTASTFTVGFFVDGTRVDTAYYRGGGLAQNESVSLRGYLDTTDLPASTYNLRVVVDPDERLADNDRMNNEMIVPFRVNDPPARLAELHPTDIEVTPPSPLLRDDEAPPDGRHEVAIVARIKNEGDIDSGRFQVEFASRYRASADAAWGPFYDVCDTGAGGCSGPFFCVRQDVMGLARGASKLLRLNCDVTDWPEGLYEVRVTADPGASGKPKGEVEEQDEHNNVMIIGFRIGATDATVIPPTEEPNLVFSSLVVDPAQNVDARERVAITEAVIWNAGRKPAGTFDVALCWQGRDGSCVPTGVVVTVDGLEPDAKLDLAEEFGTVDAPGVVGSYELCGQADVANTVVEGAREGDNEKCAHVQVTGMVKPDIAVSSAWFSDESPFEVGTSVTAFARIENASPDVGAGAFVVRFEQIDGGPVRDYTISSLGPGQARDLSFGLSTSGIGDFTLKVTADVNEQVTETDDDEGAPNNTVTQTFSVVEIAPEPAVEALDLESSVRFLAQDSVMDIVYAVTLGGRVAALRASQEDQVLFDVALSGNDVVDVVLDPGAALFVAQPDVVRVLDPSTGAVADEILIPESMSATCLALCSNGTLYVGTDAGVMVVGASGGITMAQGPQESVLELAVDDSTRDVYALTASTVYVLDDTYVTRCLVDDLPGAPVALAVGPNAFYVGTTTDAVHAYSLCSESGVLQIWQYAAEGPISSIVVDPSDFDPIYVATEDGRLIALNAFGQRTWTFAGTDESPLASLVSPPVWDGRTRRVFLVDSEGAPWVLSSAGHEAFAIDAGASAGVSVRSTLAIDDYIITTQGSGAHIERVYYYGGEDGKIYVVRTER